MNKNIAFFAKLFGICEEVPFSELIGYVFSKVDINFKLASIYLNNAEFTTAATE